MNAERRFSASKINEARKHSPSGHPKRLLNPARANPRFHLGLEQNKFANFGIGIKRILRPARNRYK
jgi:hypothetical protein